MDEATGRRVFPSEGRSAADEIVRQAADRSRSNRGHRPGRLDRQTAERHGDRGSCDADQQRRAAAWRSRPEGDRDGDPADWEAATRAFALQTKIVGDWQEAGAEQARAFRMRQIAQEARSDYTSSVSSVIQNVGSENVEDALRKIASLKTPQQISGFTAALRGLSSRHASICLVHLPAGRDLRQEDRHRRALPDLELVMRYTAEKAGELGLNQGGVPAGESAQLLYGDLGSFADAIRAGYRGLMAGRSQYGEFRPWTGWRRRGPRSSPMAARSRRTPRAPASFTRCATRCP